MSGLGKHNLKLISNLHPPILLVGRGNYNKDENSNSDTDSVLNDTASVGSGYSSAELRRANAETAENGGENGGKSSSNGHHHNEDEDEHTFVEVDDFESKLDQVLDYLQGSVKAAKSRLGHYESLAKALTTRFCLEYLDERLVQISTDFVLIKTITPLSTFFTQNQQNHRPGHSGARAEAGGRRGGRRRRHPQPGAHYPRQHRLLR